MYVTNTYNNVDELRSQKGVALIIKYVAMLSKIEIAWLSEIPLFSAWTAKMEALEDRLKL